MANGDGGGGEISGLDYERNVVLWNFRQSHLIVMVVVMVVVMFQIWRTKVVVLALEELSVAKAHSADGGSGGDCGDEGSEGA